MTEENRNCNCPGLALKESKDKELRTLWNERKFEQFGKLFIKCLSVSYHEEDCPVYSLINEAEKVTLTLTFLKKKK